MQFTLWRNNELLGGIEELAPPEGGMVGGFFQAAPGFEPTHTIQQMSIDDESGPALIHIRMPRDMVSAVEASGIVVEPPEVLEIRTGDGTVVSADLIQLMALPDVPSEGIPVEARQFFARNRWFLSFGTPDDEASKAT
jgi:hypothetical protein